MKNQVTSIEQSKRLIEQGVPAQKAEERMRQKAIEAFDDMWFSGMEPDYEYHRNNFIQKMTEQ